MSPRPSSPAGLLGGAAVATRQAVRAAHEQARAEVERQRALASKARAEASRREAESQRAAAEKQRQLADRRFDQAHQLAGKFLVEFHDVIAQLRPMFQGLAAVDNALTDAERDVVQRYLAGVLEALRRLL